MTDTLTVVGIPGAGLVNDLMLHTHIDELALLGNPLVIKNIELSLLKWRRDLIFDHFHASLITQDLFSLFYRADPADIESY